MTPRRLRIACEADVAGAMRAGRALAQAAGLSLVEAQHVATAVSEVATNAWRYGRGGEVLLEPAERHGRRGVRVVVADRGPGIADVAAALRDGFSTGGSLGVGLPGARRLMDEFELRSAPGGGTVVEMRKWAGGPHGGRAPARWALHRGGGAVPFARLVRTRALFGIAAGARADEAAATCAAQAWRDPPELARACAALAPLRLAVASLSTLDGALTWLCAGPLEVALVRRRPGADTILRPPAQPALERAPKPGRASPRASAEPPGLGAQAPAPPGLGAQTLSALRDDVLVLAAERLGDARLEALAQAAPLPAPGSWPAFCVARVERGALEPRARGERPSTLDRR